MIRFVNSINYFSLNVFGNQKCSNFTSFYISTALSQGDYAELYSYNLGVLFEIFCKNNKKAKKITIN